MSTLREYLRFEFLDLVGEASEPPPASDLAASDPWHQEEDLPEPAPEDDDRGPSPEGSDEGPGHDDGNGDDDPAGPHAVSADAEDSNRPNSISAEPSVSQITRPISSGGVNADGQFDFERVLQDFVLLTFLVGLHTSGMLAELYLHRCLCASRVMVCRGSQQTACCWNCVGTLWLHPSRVCSVPRISNPKGLKP